MNNNIEELLVLLNNMIQDSWTVPLSGDRCVIEREKALDIIDDIRENLPTELKQARSIVESRNEVLAAAKREAEALKRQAEERARTMVSENEIVVSSRQRAAEMVNAAETKSNQIVKAANDYIDAVLRKTEESVAATMSELKAARAGMGNLQAPGKE
jgi:cell division septum initiation protein DivIVA